MFPFSVLQVFFKLIFVIFDCITFSIVYLSRGDNIDVGLRNLPPLQSSGRTVTDGNPVPLHLAPDYERSVEDMLIAYSTLPGKIYS